jgi:hypothetical protein
MQNAMSGVLQKKMAQRGFASNDPRWGVTLQSAGAAIGGAAAAAAVVTAAGITAPAWITAGVTLGLTTAFAYAIDLAIDGIVKWLFNGDGTVSTTGAQGGFNAPFEIKPMSTGGPTWWNIGANVFAGDIWTAARAHVICGKPMYGWCSDSNNVYTVENCVIEGGTNGFCDIALRHPLLDCGAGAGNCPPSISSRYIQLSFQSSGGPANCAAGTYFRNPPQECTDAQIPKKTGEDLSSAQPNTAVSKIPSDDLAKPVNPMLIAGMINKAMQNAAAQPGYSGVPYDAANPVTESDVIAWKNQNPTSYPTVSDLTAPQPSGSTGPGGSPWTLPNSPTPVTTFDPSTGVGTVTNPGAGAQMNLGPDPNITAPGLESTPTAQMILSPVLSMMPSLKNFVVPSHQSTCPAPSMTLFERHLVLDGHCALTEAARPTLYAVMAFVWLLAAVLIILAA